MSHWRGQGAHGQHQKATQAWQAITFVLRRMEACLSMTKARGPRGTGHNVASAVHFSIFDELSILRVTPIARNAVGDFEDTL